MSVVSPMCFVQIGEAYFGKVIRLTTLTTGLTFSLDIDHSDVATLDHSYYTNFTGCR